MIQELDLDLDFDDELELAEITRDYIDGIGKPKVHMLSTPKPIGRNFPIEEMPVDLYMDRCIGWSEIK